MPAAKARTRNRKRKETVEQGPVQEIVATVLLGLALLLFLSLASFNIYDIPSWVPFGVTDRPNDPVQNFIGPIGAIVSGTGFFLLGAAAYLVPTGLIWFGVCQLLSAYRMPRRAWFGFALVLVATACLLHVQDFAFGQWRSQQVTPEPGGSVGYALGGTVLSALVGGAGAGILLVVALIVGLAMMTGMHPVQLLRHLRDKIGAALGRWRENGFRIWRRAPEPAPAPRRRAARKKEPAPEEPVLPLEDMPEPRIIDASTPNVEATEDKKKPTLEELREQLRKKREGGEVVAHTSATDLATAYKGFQLPPLNLLDFAPGGTPGADKGALLETQRNIIRTLATFNIAVTPGDITRGPTITRYEVYPAEGLRVKRIAEYEADIARATMAETINILAPIPGRDTVGIEIANSKKVLVTLRELLQDNAFQKSKAKIPLALGKDVYGKTIIGDLAAMPHLLVSGATGAGKSVSINCIISSLLYQFRPDEMRFVMVDPKVVELQPYKNLPHLAIPLVTEPKKVLLALRWVVKEMENRYQIFKRVGCRDFTSFNSRSKRTSTRKKSRPAAAAVTSASFVRPVANAGAPPEPEAAPVLPGLEEEEIEIPDKLPYIVVIIDELADLMDTAPADVELAIVRIAQMARAAGIHLILATQTPRADVITGRIRANVPCKIAFRVSSALESRVILENKGAERLVGKGDLLFLAPGTSTLTRAQGALITDAEVERLVAYVGEQGEPLFEESVTQTLEGEINEEDEISAEDEETLERCLEVLRQERKASTSMLQRRLRLGYNRASRMMDILEQRGFVGPEEGAKPREILVDLGTRSED